MLTVIVGRTFKEISQPCTEHETGNHRKCSISRFTPIDETNARQLADELTELVNKLEIREDFRVVFDKDGSGRAEAHDDQPRQC